VAKVKQEIELRRGRGWEACPRFCEGISPCPRALSTEKGETSSNGHSRSDRSSARTYRYDIMSHYLSAKKARKRDPEGPDTNVQSTAVLSPRGPRRIMIWWILVHKETRSSIGWSQPQLAYEGLRSSRPMYGTGRCSHVITCATHLDIIRGI